MNFIRSRSETPTEILNTKQPPFSFYCLTQKKLRLSYYRLKIWKNSVLDAKLVLLFYYLGSPFFATEKNIIQKIATHILYSFK